MERIKEVPILGPVINIFDTYPRISAWVILSAGIIILLLIEARDVGLTVGNWIALIIVSILVAGLSIWIVSWEDEDEADAEATVVKSKNMSDEEAAVLAEKPTDITTPIADIVSEPEDDDEKKHDDTDDDSPDDDASDADDGGSDDGGSDDGGGDDGGGGGDD